MAEIRNIGVTGALVTFADAPSAKASAEALSFRAVVDAADVPGVTETAPTLTSVYVGFDPLVTDFAAVAGKLATLVEAPRTIETTTARRWSIPVVFDGPDLEPVAAEVGRSPTQVIEQITATPLTVLMLGFAPGQPYLGLLPKDLSLPRRKELQNVPPGAVVTAVGQITMFDQPSPTGWRWIGRMAFRMFSPGADPAILLAPGDTVTFDPVSADKLEERSKAGNGGATCRLN